MAKKTSSAPAAKAADKSEPKKPRELNFRRGDVVRFRKRSQIARGLGADEQHHFTVQSVSHEGGRTFVTLLVGSGKHSAAIKVPPGHLAMIKRADEMPEELKSCFAKLARYKGPVSDRTRQLAAEFMRRSG